MAESKRKGIPFPISLNTRPRQYGLTDFRVTRCVLNAAGELQPPTDITANVEIDEFTVAVIGGYTQSPSVSVQGFAKAERIGIHDPGKEISTGDIINLAGSAYAVLALDLDVNGDGHLDLALPLRADVPAGTVITESGATGNYRLTITESTTGTVQYNVVVEDAYPAIDVTTQVLDVVSGTEEVLIDNSKLLL